MLPLISLPMGDVNRIVFLVSLSLENVTLICLPFQLGKVILPRPTLGLACTLTFGTAIMYARSGDVGLMPHSNLMRCLNEKPIAFPFRHDDWL
jgi:hypothetical protein